MKKFYICFDVQTLTLVTNQSWFSGQPHPLSATERRVCNCKAFHLRPARWQRCASPHVASAVALSATGTGRHADAHVLPRLSLHHLP